MPKNAKQRNVKTLDAAQWRGMTLKVHSMDSFWRANLADVFRIAAKNAKRTGEDGSVRINGHIKLTPMEISPFGGVGFSGCVRMEVCWESEADKQTFCHVFEICGEWPGDRMPE